MTNTQAAKTKAATTPAPVQISSESQATGALCSEYVINTDYSNPLAALFFYQLPGADGNCFTADDIFRYTPLSADANTAPRSAPTLPFSGQRVEAFYDSTLKAVSFVAPVFFHNAPLNQPQNALLMYDAQLQNPRTIASDLQEGGRPLAQNLGGKLYHVFDRKSGKQLIVRVTAYGTVNTLQTLSNNDSPGGAGRSTDDGVNFYYFSGGALLRLAMDGSGPAVQIGTLPAGVTGFQVVGTTDQAVLVQGSLSDGSGKLYSVPKNPPTPPVAATMLDAIPAKSYLPFIVTQGANVYYTVQAVDNSLIKAVTAKDDGSSTTPMANARWAYYVVDNRTPAGLYDDRQVTDLILVHGFTNFQQTFDNGGTVTAVHLADNTTTDLTTLKYSTGVFLRFPDNGDPLGVGTIFQGTVNGGATDMFAFEIRASDPAARFAQITSTGANPGLIRDLRDLLSGAVNGAKRLINFE